ncbi:MAG: PHP domain-containing protein, partial [Pseudomonadota bacterium]
MSHHSSPALAPVTSYAELHCITSFSFLRGASQPEELVRQSAAHGYRALAITDECSVAGVVRAHTAARETGLAIIVGSEFRLTPTSEASPLEEPLHVVLLATSRRAYGQLCRLITNCRRRTDKGTYRFLKSDLEDACALDECLAVWMPPPTLDEAAEGTGHWLRERFAGRLWIGVALHACGDDRARARALEALGERLSVPLTATGDVHMHGHADPQAAGKALAQP